MKGQMSEAELHFIRARLRGGILSKARRGELITPLPVGLVYDAAAHVILDPDTAVRGALAHLFATFEATGSASACVKAFNAAGLRFPWRHLKGPRKGEIEICTTIPGHSPDQRIGMLLIETLTPLAIEAALTVQAELQHRADEADALRAAHVERARYHADLARRRYLAVDPANRLVADTLEADWNTALRALSQAQDACDQARKNDAGQLTDAQKTRIRQLVTNLPAIWNDPATPARERKRITRLLLTDVTVTRTRDTITAHVRPPGGQHHTLTTPVPPTAAQMRKTPAEAVTAIDELLGRRTHTEIAGILNARGLT